MESCFRSFGVDEKSAKIYDGIGRKKGWLDGQKDGLLLKSDPQLPCDGANHLFGGQGAHRIMKGDADKWLWFNGSDVSHARQMLNVPLYWSGGRVVGRWGGGQEDQSRSSQISGNWPPSKTPTFKGRHHLLNMGKLQGNEMSSPIPLPPSLKSNGFPPPPPTTTTMNYTSIIPEASRWLSHIYRENTQEFAYQLLLAITNGLS